MYLFFVGLSLGDPEEKGMLVYICWFNSLTKTHIRDMLSGLLKTTYDTPIRIVLQQLSSWLPGVHQARPR